MDTRKQSEIDKIIEAFLAQMPTKHQSEAAKRLNIPRKRFHDYYNHRYNPPEALLVEMERFLHECGIYISKDKKTKFKVNIAKLSILERAGQAKAFIDQAEERRGKKRTKNNSEKILNRENFCDLNEKKCDEGRLDQFAAKKFGFGNATTLRQIFKVLEKENHPLQQAINEGDVRIDQAYQLLNLPSNEQLSLLKKSKKEIDAYLEAVMPLVRPIKTRSQIYANLVKKEAEIHQPLCQIALGLRLHSDKKGYFAWQPAQLREWILPSVSEADFMTSLEALCDCDVIKKNGIGQHFVGKNLF